MSERSRIIVVRMSFPSFTKSDFLAFEEGKKKSKRYNNERKKVWEKLKLVKDFIDIGLEKNPSSGKGQQLLAKYVQSL